MQFCRSSLVRRVALLTLFGALLVGCAGAPQKKESEAGTRVPVNIPAEVRADFKAAMVLIKDKKYQKGIELLNKVVAKTPNVAIPYIDIAIAQEKLGKLKPAEASLKHALKLEPDNPVANNEYGIIYRKTGRFKEARKIYESLLEKYPHFALAHKNLGILCDIYLRDYDCALREYKAYLSAVPDDKHAKIWIADLQARVKK